MRDRPKVGSAYPANGDADAVIASGVALITSAIAQYAVMHVHTAVAASIVPMICVKHPQARARGQERAHARVQTRTRAQTICAHQHIHMAVVTSSSLLEHLDVAYTHFSTNSRADTHARMD
jgi:hypothetical protein